MQEGIDNKISYMKGQDKPVNTVNAFYIARYTLLSIQKLTSRTYHANDNNAIMLMSLINPVEDRPLVCIRVVLIIFPCYINESKPRLTTNI